jgi:serine/threonine-protein kinase
MAEQWSVPGYTEVRELGSGATGRVVHAVHDGSGAPVAIKYLSSSVLADAEWRARFRAEARLLAGLRDDNLVRFHEYVEHEHGAAIVMELVDGVTLRQLLNRTGRMAPEPALTLLKGSLLGLAAAHGVGVVHRDYKPANVLVDANGRSKLADFGIAVPAGVQTTVAGTPSYLAPEQWAGWPPTPAGDVYAATTVFFECLTGNRPFHAHEGEGDLAKVHMRQPVPLAEVPEPVRPLVAAGLAKHPDQRPPSAAEFVRQLESVAGQAYGDEWESRGRKRLAGLAAALASLFPLAAHLAGGTGVPGSATPSSAPPGPGGPAGTSVPPVPKPWRLKAGAALAAAGALTVATVVIVTDIAEDPPPPAAARPTTPPPTTPADPFGGRKACTLVDAAVAGNAEFDKPQRSTSSSGPVVDDCYATREPGGGLIVTLFASPYTTVDPEDGELTRINGRRAEVNDNTGPNKNDVPENCGYILEVADKASVSVGVASGEENESTIDECADAHRFATVIEELLPPPR